MKFYRIYIEITNECGLNCSFCPSDLALPQKISLKEFDSIVSQASKYTKEIACHVMGDPLKINNLGDYLDIIDNHQMKALLTTSGYFIKRHTTQTLFHRAVKQINISLNSYNKNESAISLEQYLLPIVTLCKKKLEEEADLFINLRVWNLDESMSERGFNQRLFRYLSEYFSVDLDVDSIYSNRPKSIRLESKIILHFDSYFEWPSMSNPIYGDGTCQGLSSHIAILSDGRVVPCCLDSRGEIELGDIFSSPLDTILASKRTREMIDGFRDGIAKEELCQRCSYKDRFN